ncbi:DUF1428 domain-containing protein [Brevundimonas sp.]|uniref:DUF1428 domain-containing protein n=1 Tax=Brevundimonas sp. TaxID=1871086 RepID=UPI003D6C7B69
MAYVDGYVLPVKKDRIEEYRKIAQDAAAVWKEYGAREVVETVAEDVQPGKLTSFPQAVQLQDDEVVVFSWILYDSREQRDAVNAKVMQDERIKAQMNDMPVDGQRMFWGGFDEIVRA